MASAQQSDPDTPSTPTLTALDREVIGNVMHLLKSRALEAPFGSQSEAFLLTAAAVLAPEILEGPHDHDGEACIKQMIDLLDEAISIPGTSTRGTGVLLRAHRTASRILTALNMAQIPGGHPASTEGEG